MPIVVARDKIRHKSKSRPFDLYPRNRLPQLDESLFRHPTSKYRGTPFWSWNNRLSLPQLLRQIEQFKQMGFGGFHIHSRTGLATPYLGNEFMAAVIACTEKAASESMLAWLYDEDRWPSGFAGGLVTSDESHRRKHLLWTTSSTATGTLLARYEVVVRQGRLVRYRRVAPAIRSTGNAVIWHAYLQTAQPESWFNGQTYVDTLSRPAIERFIEVTHEAYAAAVGQHFGGVVPAIFTDEPQFAKKTHFRTADEQRDLVMPFTTDFPETYRASYGEDLLDRLPELFWDLPGGQPSRTRWRYHDHTAERFAAAFGDTIGRWCESHGIALTGHMLGEVNLFSQTRGVGEAMRAMRSFQIPGIDILVDRMELTTAKQAQSLARQRGRAGVVSELYGVTNWDFDFVGHKAQGDWQAALGVTVRVPHLAWASMAGEAKRDYPAPIGYQSPWWREYRLIEDHFARIATVLSRGTASVRIAVIHPIESLWLNWGPMETNQPAMEEQEEAFQNLVKWLSFGLIDFDYISEALLPELCPKQSGKRLAVGKMRYEVVIVPNLQTIRSTTLSRLKSFAAAGGTVIFAGNVPSLIDAAPSTAAQRLGKHCVTLPFAKKQILEALQPFRDLEVRHEDGTPADSLLHQLRIDGKSRHLFICNTDRAVGRNNVRLRVQGQWTVIARDTMTGQSDDVSCHHDDGDTVILQTFRPHDHLLLTLNPTKRALKPVVATEQPRWTEAARLHGPVPITLSEPNVLLLDQASWRLDEGDWQPSDEILRIDAIVRAQLGLPPRGGRMGQPWADDSPAPVVGTLQLRFSIRSDVLIKSPQLALEQAAHAKITLDGQTISSTVVGWWVDEAIETVALPDLSAGVHEIVLTVPMTRKTDVEWCYLLGDFGVAVAGRNAHLTSPPRELAFGDWTTQGLPFYAGNVTYHCVVAGNACQTLVEIPKFRNPLLSLDLDGQNAGKIAFAPFQCELGELHGEHRLDITAYGNRVNAFGPVHLANPNTKWIGPDAWRQTGVNWSYEYQLKPTGILMAPIIKTLTK